MIDRILNWLGFKPCPDYEALYHATQKELANQVWWKNVYKAKFDGARDSCVSENGHCHMEKLKK